MSSSFNFGSGSTADSIDDSPLSSAADDTVSTASYAGGLVTVDMSDDLITHSKILGKLRNDSGGMGKTHANFGNTAVHQQGVVGEAGLAVAYDEYEVDEAIYQNGGDGGIDGELELGGEMRTIDIKCPTYAADPWLKVEADIVESKSNPAEAYVVATIDDKGYVTYHGWLPADEVVTPENKRTTRQRGSEHKNYTVEGGYNDMPEPSNHGFEFSQ